MRNNKLFKRLQQYFTPSELGSVQDIRQQVLRAVSWIIVVVGLLLLGLSLEGFLASGTISLFFILSVTSFLYLLVLTIFSNRVPYLVRAISVIVIALIQGYFNVQGLGLAGDGRTWLMFANLFSTVLLGIGPGLLVNLISGAIFAAFGYLSVSGYQSLGGPGIAEFNASLDNWISIMPTFVLVSLVLTTIIGLIIRGIEQSRDTLEESYNQTRELTDKLELEQDRLASQTVDLERRLTQIRTAAEISRTLGTILDPQELLQRVADLIRERFDLYYVGVFQVDENRRFAQLVAGTGEAGARMLADHHQLAVGGASMVGWAVSHGEPRISQDVGQESVRFRNPHLPETRSEMALPIRVGNQTSGAISVQAIQPTAFDQDDITILQGIADSLAVALENASLFQQFESSLREIQQLNRQYMTDSWQNIWAERTDEHAAEKGSIPAGELLNEFDIPLTLRGDQVIGNITLATDQENLSAEERDFVEAVSDQAALALESARLLDEANRRVEQERAIHELTTRFSQSLDFDSLLQTIVEELAQIPSIRGTSIHITPPEILAENSMQETDK